MRRLRARKGPGTLRNQASRLKAEGRLLTLSFRYNNNNNNNHTENTARAVDLLPKRCYFFYIYIYSVRRKSGAEGQAARGNGGVVMCFGWGCCWVCMDSLVDVVPAIRHNGMLDKLWRL